MLLARRQALLLCAFAAVTVLVCAGLLTLAAVAAPPVVLPLVIAVCVGCPVAAGYDARGAVRTCRRAPAHLCDPTPLETLRRQLADLPETPHPLGL
jgi:hypothetical protein